MSTHLYHLAMTVPWMITEPALEAMLSIAAQTPLSEEEIKQRMHGPKSLALRDGTRRDDSRRVTMRDGVALIPIDGPIYRYADFFTDASGGVTTEALAKDIQRALDDPAVQALLFVVDSPGGEATGIGELANTIYAARGRKPMTAYVEGYGASAAYYLASAADEVVVDADALLGSIGTVLGIADPAKRMKWTIDFVSTQSPKKRVDPTTEAGRLYYQGMVDAMTETFIATVARNRSLSREQVLATEGGLLIGQAAVDAGLADRLGSEEATIEALRKSARATAPASRFARVAAHQEHRMDPKETETAPATQGADTAALQSQLEEMRRQLATERTARITTEAAAFVDGQVRDNHLLPAEASHYTALYAQLATDDLATPLASGSRLDLLRGAVNARPGHSLDKERVPTGETGDGATVLANRQKTPVEGDEAPMSEERRATLLGKTDVGRSVLPNGKAH